MRSLKGFSFLPVVLTILFVSGQVYAQSDTGQDARVFGLGQPATVKSLPPGQLRDRLDSLPPQASSTALKWLQGFSFPAADLDTLEVDDEGGVFYGDTLLPEESATSEGPTTPAQAPQATLDDAFLLHSRPGAPNVVFVDFDGDVISGTAWNGTYSTLNALPFNVEGTGNTFSTLERTRIVDIWHRIAEDLAPYDIDVTTEEPTTFNSTTGHILVTHTIDANGNPINCTSCGGVAYVNVFGRSNYHTFYSPALVFFDKLGSGGETYVAEASSHEFGHNLGLSHDGTISGTTYYGGHGTGLVSWAPIMGNSYYNNITEWSIGEYPDANQTQNDLAIIDGKLGYRLDDHGDTRATASVLSVDGTGSVVSSNPELDPHNMLPENKGIINSATDTDVFSFATGSGAISLTINPSWDAFYRSSSRRGSNLDIEAELQDLSGNQIALNEPVNDTKATVNATVNAGTYYLLITGVGNAVTPYSDYDSLGQYFISGSVPPASADETAPTPNPMTWASTPSAISDSAISMTATTAVDDISAVEYNFICAAGGTGCTGSGWQTSSGHTATGLAASTQYTYQVTARDQAGNATGSSGPASATTAAPPPPPVAPSGLSAIGTSETAIALAWVDNASTETAYRVERALGGSGFSPIANLAANASSYNDTGLLDSTTYDYRVTAVNDSGDSGFDTASGTTMTPPPPPPYTNYGANSETPVSGTVSGSYSNTLADGGSTQSITERDSGGKRANRYSQLEHRWNFTVNAGATITVYANAWSGGSAEGDSFDFEYSANGGGFLPLFNVAATGNTNLQMAVVPGAPSGAITIRVVDTDHTPGNRERNTVFVDHLYIQVGNPSNDLPDGNPSAMSASAVSSSQIDLAWTNGSSNESGLKVERSPNGSDWATITDLPAASTSYSDTGLEAATHYYYRVSAYTQPELISAYTSADTTTLAAPPPMSIELFVFADKNKGKHEPRLTWNPAATNMDVYFNSGSSPITTDVASGWAHLTGNKGGATYTYMVCETVGTACSGLVSVTY